MNELMIALPGALGGTRCWEALANEMRESCGEDFLAWDVLADVAEGVNGMQDWADGFVHKVETLRCGRNVILLGYSMGARLAMVAACRSPGTFSHAVFVSGHPGLSDETEKAERRMDDAAWADRVRSLPWPEVLGHWEARPIFSIGVPVQDWRNDLRDAWLAEREELVGRRQAVAKSLELFSLGNQQDLSEALSDLTIPSLWITGGKDSKFSGLAAKIAGRGKRVRHHCVAGIGHRVPWEAPEEFLAVLENLKVNRGDL